MESLRASDLLDDDRVHASSFPRGLEAFALRFPLACGERARLNDGARTDESGAGETVVGLNSSPSPHNEREDEQHAEPAQRVTFQNCPKRRPPEIGADDADIDDH